MRLVTYSFVFVFCASGCRFGVAALDGHSASASGPDLALPQPQPDGGPDGPGVGPDLALAPDLAAAVDMASPCTTVNEIFDATASSRWVLAGNAALDGKQLLLTTTDTNVAGSAFYKTALYTTGFDATFRFRLWDGSGADGLAFVFAKAPSAESLGVFGNGQVNTAWSLGYFGMNGFAIELDTYKNQNNGDPDNNHVGFMVTSNGTHLMTGSPSQSLRSAGGHTAHIRFAAGHLRVDIDGNAAIDDDLPPAAVFLPDDYWFGFTGAAGGLTDHHTVSSLTLVVGPDSCL
jgi:hypothetical protein